MGDLVEVGGHVWLLIRLWGAEVAETCSRLVNTRLMTLSSIMFRSYHIQQYQHLAMVLVDLCSTVVHVAMIPTVSLRLRPAM